MSESLQRAIGEKHDDELLRQRQGGAETPSIDSLVAHIVERMPEWRLDRLTHNAEGRWYVGLEHRTKAVHKLMAYARAERDTPTDALLAAIRQAEADGGS